MNINYEWCEEHESRFKDGPGGNPGLGRCDVAEIWKLANDEVKTMCRPIPVLVVTDLIVAVRSAVESGEVEGRFVDWLDPERMARRRVLLIPMSDAKETE